jgi:cell division septation protein DedD
LPLYIVLGILGTLVLIAGVVIAVIKLRDLTSKPAPPNDVPLQEAPAPKIDRHAENDELSRYSDVVAVRQGNYEAPCDPL